MGCWLNKVILSNYSSVVHRAVKNNVAELLSCPQLIKKGGFSDDGNEIVDEESLNGSLAILEVEKSALVGFKGVG